MHLRSYQSEAVTAVRQHWDKREPKMPAVVLATGGGKTVVFSELSRQLEAEGQRVLILVHREELAQQTIAKLKAMGCKSVGLVKAQTNECWARIVVATVQTLYSKRRLSMIGGVNVVIYDEMHHSTSTRNRQLLKDLGCFDGRARAAGFTATFTRTDTSKLGDDWEVVLERDVVWMVEHGFLTDISAHSIRVPDLDLSKVKKKAGGDFADGDLGEAVSASSASEVIPNAWRKYADGLPTILFAPTISTAHELSLGFISQGISSEVVIGTTPTAERHAVYDRVRSGQTKVLASVGVLTEGFDVPAICCAIMARPTKSKGLWQQMAGRALRLFPGKDKAILLDITGDALNHSLASITDLSRKKVRDEDEDPEKRAVALCACSESPFVSCCSPSEVKLDCRRNQDKGLCDCNCLCALAYEEPDEIELLHGDSDVEVDLFAGSVTVWLKTWKGVWFVPTQARIYFISQRPDIGDGYFVGYSGGSQTMTGGGWLTDEPLDMTTAMAVAQEAAQNEDDTVSHRDAGWRRRKPSQAQIKLAMGLGLLPADLVETVRKGPVSDVISMHFASRMLDPKIGTFILP